MLHRLLQAATTFGGREGGGQRGFSLQPPLSLESVTEEAHTRDLLFPNANALRVSQHSALPSHIGQIPATPRDAANYDDRGGLDVNFPADIRILIAQDANAKYPSQILFDSKSARAVAAQSQAQEPGPSPSQRLHHRGKSSTSPQKPATRAGHQPSLSAMSGGSSHLGSPTSPLSPETGNRRAGLSGNGHHRALPSDAYVFEPESSQARLAREKEETDALLNCVFGSPGMRLESGTKLHILPKNFPHAERGSSRTRPYSSQGPPPPRVNFQRSSTGGDAARSSPQQMTAPHSRSSVMITKLFNVQLPDNAANDTDHGDANADGGSSGGGDAARPGTAQSKAAEEPRRVKQKKTPMYAVAIIIQLPHDHFPRSRSNPMPAMAPFSTSYQMSAPNSPRSAIHIPPFNSMDNRTLAPTAAVESGVSVHITYILAQWVLLSRNIRLLEISAESRLRHLLEHVVPLAPVPVASQGKAGNLKLRRPKMPSQQAVYVAGDALQEDLQIRKQVDEAAYNIVFGLRARRVVSGQGRWGSWREEARWVSRWVGSKEQNFFFFTFISAFLGQHPNWLEYIAPRRYGSRARRQRLYNGEETDTLPQKTVIICKDKMVARRLVYLAASFLPTPLKTNPPAFVRHGAMSESYSESPPAPAPITPRDRSRRSTLRRDSPNTPAAQTAGTGHNRSVSFSVASPPDDTMDEEDRMTFGEQLGRRASEAGSVRSTFTNLPTATKESNKTSTSANMAESALPVAHFSHASPETPRDPAGPRPGSNGSMASVALNSALRRSESSAAGSNASFSGRFGSMMSGFWSAAGAGTESSIDGSPNELSSSTLSPDNAVQTRKPPPTMLRGQSTSVMRPAIRSPTNLTNPTRLDMMVEETSYLSRGSPIDRSRMQGDTMLGRSLGSQRQPLDLDFCLKKTATSGQDKTAAKSIPTRPESERLPITLNMNNEEGFVDVAMPQGMSISSSLASSFASLRMNSLGYSFPNGSGATTWNSSAEASEHHSPYGSPTFTGVPSPKPESLPSVAGWLKVLHPDFVLQAVRPYDGLQADIKQTLECEAKLSCHPEHGATSEEEGEAWNSVCSILVADTTKYTVEKHTLQRRKRQAYPEQEARGKGNDRSAGSETTHRDHTSPPFLLSPSSSTASLPGPGAEEQIAVEPLMDMDPILIDAIERLLSQSGPSSRVMSRAPSRVPSRAPSPARSRPVSVKSTSIQHSPQSSSATKQAQLKNRERAVSSATAPPQPTGGNKTTQHVPFRECRRIILSALDEIAKTVIEERESAQTSNTETKQAKGSVLLTGGGLDGSLREGVVRWLDKVEEGARP